VSPSRKRAAAEDLQAKFSVSERRACEAVGQPRSSQRYEAKPPGDEASLVTRMLQLAKEHVRYGYRRITALLKREGWRVNVKRVYRLWRKEGLKVPQKKRKKRRLGVRQNGCDRRGATHKNDVWAWDFVFDRTTSGSPIKCLTLIDEHTRESLALKIDRSITSEDLIDTLCELFAMRGVPGQIRSDNGPEFVAKELQRWLDRLDVGVLYVEPGSPWQNGYAESFNSKFRDEFLAIEEFEGLAAARKLGAAWREDYNHHRPHSSLGYLTPAEFAARCPHSAPQPLSATPQAAAPLRGGSGITHPVLS